MVIDVSSILKETGGTIKISGEIGVKDTDFLGEVFHFKNPLSIAGSFVNNGKSIILRADVKGQIGVCCARCRKPITVNVKFPVEETFIQGKGDFDSDEDIYVFSGQTIDLDDVVFNNFLMNVSGKYLCKEDCKGLCSKCGADLNSGECGCKDDNIDPRWEALRAMIKDTETE